MVKVKAHTKKVSSNKKEIRIVYNFFDDQNTLLQDIKDKMMTKKEFDKFVRRVAGPNGLDIEYDWNDGYIEHGDEEPLMSDDVNE